MWTLLVAGGGGIMERRGAAIRGYRGIGGGGTMLSVPVREHGGYSSLTRILER